MKLYTPKTRLSLAALSMAAVLASTTASADVVHATDAIIIGNICAGFGCVDDEAFGGDLLRLEDANNRIHFDDNSTSAGYPANDWRIIINDELSGGADYFAIEDATGGVIPFRIEAGADANTLYVDSDGYIGMGTALPTRNLHIVDGNTPTIRLEQDGSGGFASQTWDMAGNHIGFFIQDVTASSLPFQIRPGAPSSSIDIAADGDVGMGTDTPTAPLHIKRDDSSAALLIEETSGIPTGRTMFTLKNNGGSFFRMENSDTGGRWVFAHENAAPNRFLINKDGGNSEFILDGSGNLSIVGSITTTGGTCGGGCDAVFGADYDLPTIAEYSQQMWANQYLPHVGPTVENAPINVSDKLGRMLNALEHAHIYIGQQEMEISAQKEENGRQNVELHTAQQRISTLEMRLKALESKLN